MSRNIVTAKVSMPAWNPETRHQKNGSEEKKQTLRSAPPRSAHLIFESTSFSEEHAPKHGAMPTALTQTPYNLLSPPNDGVADLGMKNSSTGMFFFLAFSSLKTSPDDEIPNLSTFCASSWSQMMKSSRCCHVFLNKHRSMMPRSGSLTQSSNSFRFPPRRLG